MCNRFNSLLVTKKDGTQTWVKLFYDESDFDQAIQRNRNYLIQQEYKPLDKVLVIREYSPGKVRPDIIQWGLYPDWSDRPIANTRMENMFDSEFWKSSSLHSRCLIPVNSFFEWKDVGLKKKSKYKIRFKNPNTCFAGLYGNSFNKKTNQSEPWVTIITQEGNSLMKEIHNSGENKGRQPACIPEVFWEQWLDPKMDHPPSIKNCIEYYDQDAIDAQPDDEDPNFLLFPK
jgi:putative SOS response-associated peptidase YedK